MSVKPHSRLSSTRIAAGTYISPMLITISGSEKARLVRNLRRQYLRRAGRVRVCVSGGVGWVGWGGAGRGGAWVNGVGSGSGDGLEKADGRWGLRVGGRGGLRGGGTSRRQQPPTTTSKLQRTLPVAAPGVCCNCRFSEDCTGWMQPCRETPAQLEPAAPEHLPPPKGPLLLPPHYHPPPFLSLPSSLPASLCQTLHSAPGTHCFSRSRIALPSSAPSTRGSAG